MSWNVPDFTPSIRPLHLEDNTLRTARRGTRICGSRGGQTPQSSHNGLVPKMSHITSHGFYFILFYFGHWLAHRHTLLVYTATVHSWAANHTVSGWAELVTLELVELMSSAGVMEKHLLKSGLRGSGWKQLKQKTENRFIWLFCGVLSVVWTTDYFFFCPSPRLQQSVNL